MEARYNVVFVGKTGVGKSALINYLYGDKIMKTGVGKPVTGEGFHPIDCEINGLSVRLFDSWGLEVGKEQEWLGLLDQELKKRDTGKPAEQWFHSVFYCIGAGGSKVEDFDTEVIRRFIDEKYKVAVILTKADMISEEDEETLRKTVRDDLGQEIPVIAVCSEEKKLRGGSVSEKFGKEDVELQAYNDFCDSIILRLPEHCVKVLEQRINEWYEKQKGYISNNTTYWNVNEMREIVRERCNSFIKKEFKEQNTIQQELQHTLKLYGNFVKRLSYPPQDTDMIISLPEEEKIEWWEWICIIPTLPVAIPVYLIGKVEFSKGADIEFITIMVSKIRGKLPKVESEIKKALENLKENRTG